MTRHVDRTNVQCVDKLKTGYFFEEFEASRSFVTPSRTVTEKEIAEFVELTGAGNPLFVEHRYAIELFGSPIAPGQLTLSLALGLIEPLLRGTAIALLAIDDVRFTRPLRPNTSIEVATSVLSKRPTRRRDAGVIVLANEVSTVAEERLATFAITVLVKRGGRD